MKNAIIKNLQPFEFFKWFYMICKIPHETKNEKRLVSFLIDFAKKRSIPFEVDNKGNVFMKLPASKDYEDQPKILFQAHLDMVCVKNDGVDFDFENDSIKLQITGDKLHAQGTSLGADNAVGIATMLAIADSSTIKHPSLEFLFTVEEEIGLVGIRNFDLNKITARRMINMDCGDSHVLAVSSSGKRVGDISRIFKTTPIKERTCALKLEISGGHGGHASLEVRKGIACAVNCIAELISSVSDFSVKLIRLNTFAKAIFNQAEATIAFPQTFKDKVIHTLKNRFNGIKSIYKNTDPNIDLRFTDAPLPNKTLTVTDTQKIAHLLRCIRTAPYREDGIDKTYLITLTSLYQVELMDDKFHLQFIVRSFNECDMNALFDFYTRTAKFLGFDVVLSDSCPSWEEATTSPFRDKFIMLHERLFGTTPNIERVQGGIETSIITSKIRNMDAIGVAPTARGAHTSKEYLLISEVPDYWKWLTSVLEHKE